VSDPFARSPFEDCGTGGHVMADAAIFIGWNEAKPGREAMAAQLFADAIQFYSSLVQKGTIESFEPVLLTRHGGDLNGFILLRGEASKLDAMRRSEESITFDVRAAVCLDGYGAIDAYIGDGLQRLMEMWRGALPR
jgi:hypothetical protein